LFPLLLPPEFQVNNSTVSGGRPGQWCAPIRLAEKELLLLHKQLQFFLNIFDWDLADVVIAFRDLVAEIADARLAGEFLGGQVGHMAHGEGQIEEERLAGGVLFAP